MHALDLAWLLIKIILSLIFACTLSKCCDYVWSFFFCTVSTPLIKLNKLSEETGCTIAVKAENLNPGGSVKDRAALYLIKDAEERGQHSTDVPVGLYLYVHVRH